MSSYELGCSFTRCGMNVHPQRIYSMQEVTDRDIRGIKGIDDECCSMTEMTSSYQDLRN